MVVKKRSDIQTFFLQPLMPQFRPLEHYYGKRYKRQYDAGWSSLVARRAHNPKVAGSNPAPATKIFMMLRQKSKPFFLLAPRVFLKYTPDPQIIV